jgi:hypothetical protein
MDQRRGELTVSSINRPWTEEEDAALRRMVAEGMSASMIGGEIGRARNAVVGRVHRLKARGEAIRLGPPSVKKVRPPRPPREPRPATKAKPARPKTLRHDPTPAQIADGPLPPVIDMTCSDAWSDRSPGGGEGVRFTDLKSHHCRWPLGPMLSRPERFCGERVEGATFLFCAHHRRIGTQRAT